METDNVFKMEEEEDMIRITEIQAILENNLYEPDQEKFLMNERDMLERKYELLDRSKKIKEAYDFKTWSSKDMADVFWISLGRYNRCPNLESLGIMMTAYHWAVHDNRKLADAFYTALKWSNIDFFRDLAKLKADQNN